jgi:hypothetical protein
VTAASTFIASIVAMVCAAASSSPTLVVIVTTPANGAGMWSAYRHRAHAHAQFVSGTESPDCDLTPVCHQNLAITGPRRNQLAGLSSRCGGPTYSLSGRISALDAVCSMM